MTLHEIEELIKSVNRSAIKAMLRNAAILNDPNVTDEMRTQALENVKAIAAGSKKPKVPKSKVKQAPVAQQPEPTKLAQPPVTSSPTAPAPATQAPAKIEYPDGLHLHPLNTAGHDESSMRSWFDALPDHEKKSVVDWHASAKVKKSIDTLFDLFTQLKTLS